ncbi:hypothetical protein J7E97_13600 [Streptomyces sp. ISL-66]|uniref:hypothetical protein n=1 Tax=Streptomyces sp. ISL-66 TaxID=2819186 RepID=UPI001BEB0359|nr:hypothetical protein [Streptomyces sp. ISL-66]MBT2468882.1 hypothetical protein [Streptomyces sp. ISL-66]
MAGVRGRGLAAGVGLVVLVSAAAGCSDGDGPSAAASEAASAVASAGAVVSSAASEASDAVESAAAVAKDKLSEVKDGIDAKDDVTLGAPAKDADGRTTVSVSAKNTEGSPKSFAVQVDFKDEGGKLLDTVVVTVSDVAANATGEGTARSTHTLSGTVKAETGKALRY